MSKVLVYAESHDGEVKNVTYEILGRLQGHEGHVVCLENPNDESLEKLGLYGAASITVLKSESLETYSPEAYSAALKEHISKDSYDYVFTGATSTGKDFLPRLSSSFDAGLASDIVDFTMEGDQFKGVRPLFAGKCLADVEISGPKPHFVSVRPNALGLTEINADSKPAVAVVDTTNPGELKAKITEVIKGASEKLDLTEANIIVSGGRAMGNADNFKILDEMADILGATVGASRAAVDSGYAPHSMQVGQTGKTVAPSLYIACGISGAIQHLAGMRTSKVIVAINSDKDAPIFEKADYGIVGDLFKIVPMMTEELKKTL